MDVIERVAAADGATRRQHDPRRRPRVRVAFFRRLFFQSTSSFLAFVRSDRLFECTSPLMTSLTRRGHPTRYSRPPRRARSFDGILPLVVVVVVYVESLLRSQRRLHRAARRDEVREEGTGRDPRERARRARRERDAVPLPGEVPRRLRPVNHRKRRSDSSFPKPASLRVRRDCQGEVERGGDAPRRVRERARATRRAIARTQRASRVRPRRPNPLLLLLLLLLIRRRRRPARGSNARPSGSPSLVPRRRDRRDRRVRRPRRRRQLLRDFSRLARSSQRRAGPGKIPLVAVALPLGFEPPTRKRPENAPASPSPSPSPVVAPRARAPRERRDAEPEVSLLLLLFLFLAS